jgi:hypothetical protein
MGTKTSNTHQYTASPVTVAVIALEPHFTPAQLAAMWNLSPDCIRDMFAHEVGVLKINRPERLHKRAYSTLRIPESVARRVHCKLQVKK